MICIFSLLSRHVAMTPAVRQPRAPNPVPHKAFQLVKLADAISNWQVGDRWIWARRI